MWRRHELSKRQPHRELGITRLAADRDIAVMGSDNRGHDGQPESRATARVRTGRTPPTFVAAREPLEDSIGDLGRDARSVVGDRDNRIRAAN